MATPTPTPTPLPDRADWSASASGDSTPPVKPTPSGALPPQAENAISTRAEGPLQWNVTLHKIGQYARPQGEWRTEMKVGDLVHFVSPDGTVLVEFEAADQFYKPNPGGLVPFGPQQIKIEGAGQTHVVLNSCKSIMRCYIVEPNGNTIGYPAKGAAKGPGTTVCTGGGNNPVRCP